ncbi:hypothetical protein CC85DRAFT_184834 [Cutaneotrichosporon oleaginosum]|uniref:Uncharacterized protein n=1 Tax=Cutaneotrichosporon oleaginosum TaxID=879819 RepID=A0A0J0XES4_9TREE|nr:uncharacterized protein CC85DRAFT_184834 [Cutaneotrichosporon oleaginosum]KLT39577.1 hypothetical protein CC85DRAFT_184834 [Cutaneotrichosporon oleaginosum]TXT15495.1 hypothetical protein COLE_01688 [Cutaneotrichosporon oleaginosum]
MGCGGARRSSPPRQAMRRCRASSTCCSLRTLATTMLARSLTTSLPPSDSISRPYRSSLTPSSMPVPCPANGIPDLYCIATRPGSSAAEVDASPPAPTLCFTCFSDVILADDQHFDMWAMLERQWVDGCIDMCLPQAAVPDAS